MQSDRKVELADLGLIKQHVDDLRSLLDEGTLLERKSFVRSFIKEINITDGEAVLNYTIPLSPDGTSEEKVVALLCFSGIAVSCFTKGNKDTEQNQDTTANFGPGRYLV